MGCRDRKTKEALTKTEGLEEGVHRGCSLEPAPRKSLERGDSEIPELWNLLWGWLLFLFFIINFYIVLSSKIMKFVFFFLVENGQKNFK